MSRGIMPLKYAAILSLVICSSLLIAFAEKANAKGTIDPSFRVYANGTSKTVWKTPVGEITYIEECEVKDLEFTSNKKALRPTSEGSSIQGPHAVWCYLKADVPDFHAGGRLELNVGGFDHLSAGDFVHFIGRGKQALSFLQTSFINKEAVEIEARVRGSTGTDNVVFNLAPARAYASYMNELFRLVDAKNQEINRIRLSNQRNLREIRRRRDRKETTFLVLGAIGAVLALAVLGKVAVSDPVQKKGRIISTRASAAFRRTKMGFKRKGNLSAARELMYWSSLRDKGDITQEEFEERKKNLLGKE